MFIAVYTTICDLLVFKSTDILAVTETWLRRQDTTANKADISSHNYSFRYQPRLFGQGDGVIPVLC